MRPPHWLPWLGPLLAAGVVGLLGLVLIALLPAGRVRFEFFGPADEPIEAPRQAA